jgi:hypothetical protein
MIIGIVAGVIALSMALYKINQLCVQNRRPLSKNVFENKHCTEKDLDERDYLL